MNRDWWDELGLNKIFRFYSSYLAHHGTAQNLHCVSANFNRVNFTWPKFDFQSNISFLDHFSQARENFRVFRAITTSESPILSTQNFASTHRVQALQLA